MQSLSWWESFLLEAHGQVIDMGLARVLKVAQVLGVTKHTPPVVHVGGTNGKGTCASAIASIGEAAGYRTGLYTSPHLLELNERIKIGGENVPDKKLVSALAHVYQTSLASHTSLTFFETITLAALWLFKEANLDLIVMEVGLGGRLDATNVVRADISVITSIGMDHQDWLGDNLTSIAREKAGIIKPGQAGSVLGSDTELPVFEMVCQNLEIPYYRYQHDFTWLPSEQNPNRYQFKGLQACEVPTSDYVTSSLACACQVIGLLKPWLTVSDQAIYDGIAHLKVPGRFERYTLPQEVIVDVAHNADSSALLAEKITAMPKVTDLIAVLAIVKTKSIEAVLKPWIDLVDYWWLPSLDCDGMWSPEQIRKILLDMAVQEDKIFANMSEQDVAPRIKRHEQENMRVVVFGSFRTVAAFKRVLMAE